MSFSCSGLKAGCFASHEETCQGDMVGQQSFNQCFQAKEEVSARDQPTDSRGCYCYNY
jgi:hypothetical protein